MAIERRFKRYLTATSGLLVGKIQNTNAQIRLQTFGQGGCSFIGTDPDMALIPPKKLRLIFELQENQQLSHYSEVDGQLIYIRPVSPSSELLYGIKFEDEHIPQLSRLATKMESYATQGFVDRDL